MTSPPQRLDVVLPDARYPIHIGGGLLAAPQTWTADLPTGPLLVVSNPTVAPLYLDQLLAALKTAGADRPLRVCLVPDGEAHKSLATLASVFDALVEHRIPRDGGLVALGGGVIGDLTGFAAATWQRGVACIQVPTTLLAQVDSSVGGKTAVNHPGGKNLIGAFHQPALVVADTGTLATLPPREFASGLAEVAKYGFIQDAAFIDWLEANAAALCRRDPAALAYAIRRSCEMKAHLVAIDEREQGPRALLNLGHTFGHAFEAGAGYGQFLHGEAVAIGMVLAAGLSQRLGWLSLADVQRVRALLEALGLPVLPPRLGVERTLDLMRLDKKVLRGQLRLVLLRRLGEGVVTADYPAQALLAELQAAVA
jgi:3-dehydroquinate synthase